MVAIASDCVVHASGQVACANKQRELVAIAGLADAVEILPGIDPAGRRCARTRSGAVRCWYQDEPAAAWDGFKDFSRASNGAEVCAMRCPAFAAMGVAAP